MNDNWIFNVTTIDDSIKQLAIKELKKNPDALKSMSQAFKENKEIVLEAVKQNGQALQYADDSLKNDPDILAIVNKDK